MTVFNTEHLDTWLREYEHTRRDGSVVTVSRPEFPITAYLRWLRSSDDPDIYTVKIDLDVTDFGMELMSMNAPSARQHIESEFSSYPAGLDNSRVRDLQQICEYVESGRSGPVSFVVDGGTFTVDSEEQITADGSPRTIVTGTIETPDVLSITIEDAIRATIDTRPLR